MANKTQSPEQKRLEAQFKAKGKCANCGKNPCKKFACGSNLDLRGGTAYSYVGGNS